MWEWLAAVSVAELGKLALEPVLNLGKAALEDYVKDFFKDCIKSGVAQANAMTLKQPMAEAIGCFIKRFIKELQINDVPETSIEHHYKRAIQQFVRDQAVRPILGKAFEKDCKQIDYVELQRIWAEKYQEPGWGFPVEEFDWRGVWKEYVFEVKGIIKANAELRSILAVELTEEIATNTGATAEAVRQMVGLPVQFDLARYREAILEQYRHLQLESLGSSKYEQDGVNFRTVPLWSVFVAQDVRECQDYLPQIYEIPKEQLRRLQQVGDIEAIAELEAESRREQYAQQMPRSVREIVGLQGMSDFADAPAHPYIVILGDPGSGKSTLLRYLAVKWAQQQATEQIPLLIELRRYSESKTNGECKDFVEFVHRGSNWVGHLDQQQLDDWLNRGQVLILLDGLDEVVERQQRGTVLTQIHSFTQRYPQVPVILTSRVIGYNAQTLRDAGFYHYMLQDLDETQIQAFIQHWHDLTYRNEAEKQRKQKRLQQAISDSKAIQELAGNPLLLTLMAILNRGKSCPEIGSDCMKKPRRCCCISGMWRQNY
jgi:energy-coupling factor transporter ATP-binding protein EcfA2